MKLRNKFFFSLTATLVAVLLLFGWGLSFFLQKVLEQRIREELSNTRDMLQDELALGIQSSIKTHLRTVAGTQYALADYLYGRMAAGELAEEEAYGRLRALLLDEEFGRVGETGYLAGVSSQGDLTIHPKSEGANITGASFWPKVEEVLKTDEQAGFFFYDWKNKGEEVAREKAAYVRYFEPWDLILWVSSYTSEFAGLVDVSDFRATINELVIGESGYAYVMDNQGTLLIHPTSEGKNIGERSHIREILEKGSGHISYKQTTGDDNRGRRKLVYYGRVDETGWIVAAGAYYDEIFALLGIIRIVLGAFIGVSALIILGITFGLVNQITRPLRKLQEVLRDLLEGEGDLTISLEIQSRDEIGSIAQAFDHFLAHLRGVMVSLQRVSHGNSKIGYQLSSHAEDNSRTLNDTTRQVEAMKEDFLKIKEDLRGSSQAVDTVNQKLSGLSTEIEDQAASINESSATIEEISASISSVQRIAEDRTAGMKSMVETIEEGGAKVEDTDTIIREISSNADQMAEAISIINDIADNTNLLAMNAAIEAAHAGESGKGFAVVADEIRKLSETTSENARNISFALEHVIEKVGEAKKVSTQSGEAFSSIDQEVRQAREAFQEITSSMGELSTSSGEILKAIQQINETTEDIRNRAAGMVEGTEDVTKRIFRIDDGFSHISDSLETASAGIVQIQGAVEDLAELSVKNQENLESMDAELDKFST